MDQEKLKCAVELREQRDFIPAIGVLTEIITRCLSTPGKCSKMTLADMYNERGFTKYLYVDFKGAVDDYSLALEQHQKAVYYYNRGLVHYRLARFKASVDDMTSALNLQPDFSDALQCQQQAKLDGKL